MLLATLVACDQGKSNGDQLKNAQASRDKGDISTAITEVKNALQKDPKNLEARLLLAQYYLDLPDPVAA